MYFAAWFVFTIVLFVFMTFRSHPYRFPKFLIFESLLSLIFLNAGVWFANPFSWFQILSWTLLVGSLILVSLGFYLIKSQGEPTGDFEDTTKLITTGVYRHIRHPLYTSLILFSLGVFMKDPSWLGTLLFLLAGVGVLLTARVEETHNLERFGDAYRVYMAKTKRFIPFIY